MCMGPYKGTYAENTGLCPKEITNDHLVSGGDYSVVGERNSACVQSSGLKAGSGLSLLSPKVKL